MSERHYYQLLRKFTAPGPDHRYRVDDAVDYAIHRYLAERQIRVAALAQLRRAGFTDSAARKWLQRHPLGEILAAKPHWTRANRGE